MSDVLTLLKEISAVARLRPVLASHNLVVLSIAKFHRTEMRSRLNSRNVHYQLIQCPSSSRLLYTNLNTTDTEL
jgi:hypothetical protein